jgi:hypothetical protein
MFVLKVTKTKLSCQALEELPFWVDGEHIIGRQEVVIVYYSMRHQHLVKEKKENIFTEISEVLLCLHKVSFLVMFQLPYNI